MQRITLEVLSQLKILTTKESMPRHLKIEAGIGSWVSSIGDASLIHVDQVKAQIESLIDVGLINKDSDVHVVSLAIRPTLVTLTN